MKKRLLPLLVFCSWSLLAFGQVPTVPSFPGYHPTNGPDVRTCTNTIWMAGTSNQALAPGVQSNDVEYLCMNDALDITHDGNFNLDISQDPIPATTPGISYVIYDCLPTITGSDASDIEGDPCVTNIPVPGSPFAFYLDGVVDAGGNGTFVNNGGLQTFFNGGNPLELFFAPITVTDHAGLAFEAATSTNDFCVNVTTSDAFRVVYLNEIIASNPQTSVGGNDCTGSFDIAGGLSEFDLLNASSSNYTISIVQNGNPGVTGTVTSGAATHGSTVTFTVPEAGTYDITIEDGKSCGTSISINMSACAPAFSATFNAFDATCNGDSDGSIAVGLLGGSAPYNITWQLQPGGPVLAGTLAAGDQYNINDLVAGTYDVTVTDDNGTVETTTVIVGQPGALGASLNNLVSPTCNGDADGSLSVQITSDGVLITPGPEYTFTWNIAQTGQTISNIPSGPYSVTVSDGNGCTATASATLSQPPAISAFPITVVDASCTGAADGSASISASGGTGGLQYLWSVDPQNMPTATALNPGTYTVTVTDDNGCTYTDSATVGAATVLSASTSATDITCNGADNGQIIAQPIVTGVDNGGYTFAWTPDVGSTPVVNSLAPGDYTVTITDANGCSATALDNVSEPSLLTVSVNAVDESCNVGNDGQVTAVPDGGTGTGTYTFLWNTSDTSPTLSGLLANTYTVTVIDGNGCTASASGTVNAPQGATVTSFDIVGVLCATDTNGSLTVNAVDGSAPITDYVWSNGTVGNVNSDIGPGTYTVSITDAGGCTITASETITAPPALAEATPFITTFPSCPDSGDGSITLDITGGTPPYTYNWNSGQAGPIYDVISGSAGIYTVTVTDANSCSLVISDIEIQAPNPITVNFTDIQPVSCDGGVPCDGSATITASGGLSTSYTFTWSSGESSTGGSSTAVQLCQGNQVVTVTDGFCTVIVGMDGDGIPAPPIVEIANVLTTPATCFGDSDGTATVTPTGGNGGPYNIVWSNGDTGPLATNLSANTDYTVSITDGLGCASVPSVVTVTEPTELLLLASDTTNVSCNGENDGSIQVIPIGGNEGEYTYQWSPNVTDTASLATGLAPGIYGATVTDEKGCTANISVPVNEPNPISFSFDQPADPLCNGFTTVFFLDTVYGGSGGPYFYTIDGFNYQPANQPVPTYAGEFLIQVQDIGQCSATDSLFVDEPAPIIVDLGPSVEIQLGEEYEIIPSITPLGAIDSLTWSPATALSCTDCFNPTANPLDDVTYTLLVTDENGCFGSGELLLEVDPNRNVYIPNVFTPNNDGVNDIFTPFIGPGVRRVQNMQVFDRWGELVFAEDDFLPDPLGTIGWNGYFGGTAMNPAVFVYVIEVEFEDDQVLTYKGNVTLLR